MRAASAFLLAVLLAACVATQEEPPSKQAETYVKQLGQKLPPGTPLQAAIEHLGRDGFKCREAAARPMPMGHTVVCFHGTPQAWGVTLQTDSQAKLTAVHPFEASAAKR